MAENSVKDIQAERGNGSSQEAGKSVFSGDGRLEKLFQEGIPVKYMPKILFVVGLLILYIMNSYLIEKKRVRIQKTKAEVEDLRADFTSLQKDFNFDGLQSTVAAKVKKMGLKESSTPPYRIVVRKND